MQKKCNHEFEETGAVWKKMKFYLLFFGAFFEHPSVTSARKKKCHGEKREIGYNWIIRKCKICGKPDTEIKTQLHNVTQFKCLICGDVETVLWDDFC